MSDGSSVLRRFLPRAGSRVADRGRRRVHPGAGLESCEGRVLLSGYGRGAGHPPAAVEVQVHHGRADSLSALRRSAPPGDPAVTGSWSPTVKFRPPGARGAYVAIHSTVLPDGDVLAWPHDYNYFLATRHAAPYTPSIMLWDPATNQYRPLGELESNVFCSGSTFLPDGRLMVLGGHGPAAYPTGGLQTHYGNNHAEIFDYRTNTWSAAPKMTQGRYYGSAITLGTGEVLTVAGYNEYGGNDPLIEVYKDGQGWRTLAGATTKSFPDWYPHIYQLSNGLVFGANPGSRTFFLDPKGDGRIWQGPSMNYPRRYDGASVMYAQDKILSIGGDAAGGTPPAGGSARQITGTAEAIDLASPNPTWQYTGSMHHPRFLLNATLLPDGTVLATGGTSQQDNNNGNALAGAAYSAELWDPKTGQWTEMSSMSVPRLYHSTAVLLPDARVLVAGGGDPESTGEAKGTIHDTMQIFSPPYLSRGPQPVITSAPATAGYGQTIPVTSPDASSITAINLIRPGSTTHGFNMTQKIVNVPFDRAADGTLELHLPTNPDAAPPGPYMIFLLNDKGVPSKASMLELTS